MHSTGPETGSNLAFRPWFALGCFALSNAMAPIIPTAGDLEDPARMLALDEVALDHTESTGQEHFWTWESARPWVVVGLGQAVSREVELDFCNRSGIGVFRRCSGGGAVVQGPGCLNYAVTLRMDRDPLLASVTGTNQWLMGRLRDALQPILPAPVAVRGHTDLAIHLDGVWLKFSGNAQRRRSRSLLFHGTLLHAFDLDLIARCLCHPSAEPDYRQGRQHDRFVTNLPADCSALRRALEGMWTFREGATAELNDEVRRLAEHRYRMREWNFRR